MATCSLPNVKYALLAEALNTLHARGKKQIVPEHKKIEHALKAKAKRDKIKAENIEQRQLIQQKRILDADKNKVNESYYSHLIKVKYQDLSIPRSVNTPPWADLEEIKSVHDKRKEMSAGDIKYHVDHIIPIKGKLVSGLNVSANLQIITKTENLKKHNKYEIL